MPLQKRVCSECEYTLDDILEDWREFDKVHVCPQCNKEAFSVRPSLAGFKMSNPLQIQAEKDMQSDSGVTWVDNPYSLK